MIPHRPTYDDFATLARTHTVVPVYRQLLGDTLTPVSAFEKIRHTEGAFLFESVVGGERVGRYSFLGSNPFRQFEAKGTTVRERCGLGEWHESQCDNPLKLLARW